MPVCTPVFTDMRAAQILHARMDFLGCPVFHTPAWAFGIWARSRQSGFGLNLVVGAESGEFQYWSVSIGYKNCSAVLPVCTPVFAGDTRRFCRPELFQLIPHPMAAVQSFFGGGRIGQAELQAQTHQKSVSWNVPVVVEPAHDPGPGN